MGASWLGFRVQGLKGITRPQVWPGSAQSVQQYSTLEIAVFSITIIHHRNTGCSH